jgi:hypothetical protein
MKFIIYVRQVVTRLNTRDYLSKSVAFRLLSHQPSRLLWLTGVAALSGFGMIVIEPTRVS